MSMKKIIVFIMLGISCFLVFPLVFIQEAFALETSSPANAEADGSGVSNATFEPDYFTGAATYRYSIDLPSGRQGMTPDVTLFYNSHRRSRASEVGVGWELNLYYIERSSIKGLPDYGGEDYISYENGQARQLLFVESAPDNCAAYRYKIESADQKRFFKCQNYWIMYDKSGKKYLFGQGENTRLENAAQRKTLRWYLEKVEDPNHNNILYRYRVVSLDAFFTHGGEDPTDSYKVHNIFLAEIEYAGHGDEPGTYRVDLRYDNNDHKTPDFRSEFGKTVSKHLSKVLIFERSNQAKPIHEYTFRYEEDQQMLKLAGITVQAQNNNIVTTLPETTFEYSSLADENYWVPNDDIYQDPIGQATQYDKAHRFFDMNGDGLVDRVFQNRDTGNFEVYVNTGNDFNPQAQLWPDICDGGNGSCSGEELNDLIDFNGDNLPDRILGGEINIIGQGLHRGYFVKYNSGTEFGYGELWDDPICQIEEYQAHCGELSFQDMNGDGLRDRIHHDQNQHRFLVFINEGHQFRAEAEVWIDQAHQNGNFEYFILDMNGDGLPDRVARDRNTPNQEIPRFQVFYNTGHRWFENYEEWDYPFLLGDNPPRVNLIDINSDGKPDLLNSSTLPDARHGFNVYYNLGTSFDSESHFLPDPINNDRFVNKFSYENNFPGFIDLNGDGFLDRIAPTRDDQYEVHFTQFYAPNSNEYHEPPLALIAINNGLGVDTRLSYRPTTLMKNRLLPFHNFNLAKIVVKEGNEEKATNINYAMGQYQFPWNNPLARKFDGFGFIQIRDHLGNVENRWYHQAHTDVKGIVRFVDDYLPGFDHSFSIRTRDLSDEEEVDGFSPWTQTSLSGKLYRVSRYIRKPGIIHLVHKDTTTYEWQSSFIPGGSFRRFVSLIREETTDYEGLDQGRTTVTTSAYNPETGNVINTINLGEVGVDTPRKIEFVDYLGFNTPFGEVPTSNAAQIRNVEGNDLVRNLVRLRYDERMNVISRQETLSYEGEQDQELISRFEYDEYGNVIQATNPNRTVSTTFYDEEHHLFPLQITIAGEFTSHSEYDVRIGKVREKTSPDGRIETFSYDGFGRLLERTFQGQWKERFEYEDKIDRGNGLFATAVKRFTNISSDPAESSRLARSVTYKNGQGETLQTSSRSERSDNSYRTIVMRYVQDRQQYHVFTSEPFFTPDASLIVGANHPEVISEYDSLGRVTKVTPPVGDITSPTGASITSYGFEENPWVVSFTDAEGKTKRTFYDVRGNKIQVSEFLDGQEIATQYQYDFWNNLTLIRDAAGKETRFTYDNLGRKRSSTTPESGMSTFAYDALGNIIEQRDAKGQRIVLQYDELNRLTDNLSYAPNGNEEDHLQYFYDEAAPEDRAQYSVRKGELYQVIDSFGGVKFSYDDKGNLKKQARLLAGLNGTFETHFKYYDDGRLSFIHYPKGQLEVEYLYDASGKLKRVREARSLESFYTINPETGYNEFGQLVKETYGDTTEDHYQYYDRSHRLRQIQTVKPGDEETEYRNLTFGYDAVRNIKVISDEHNGSELNTGISNIKYDDLHRLRSYESANDWEQRQVTHFSYDTIGNILRNDESFGATYQYDNTNKLTSVDGVLIQYDANGNMTLGRGRAYQYNARNRMVQVTMENGWSSHYAYDASGQRVFKRVNKGEAGSEDTYYVGSLFEIRNKLLVHNIYAGNKLIAVLARGTVDTPDVPLMGAGFISRDQNTNTFLSFLLAFCVTILLTIQMRRLLAGRTNELVPARLSTVISSNNKIVILAKAGIQQFFKDFFSPRRVNGFARSFRIVIVVFTFCIFLPHVTYAYTFREDVDDNWPAPTEHYFYYIHADHLGGSNLYTEGMPRATHGGLRYKKGDLVQRIEYTPFGQERFVLNGALAENPKFTGQTHDIDTDLHYYNARYYDSALGRFTQADSVIPDAFSSQKMNPYSYVYNNPLIYVDPSGNFGLIAAVIGGAILGSLLAVATGGNVITGAITGAISAGIFFGAGQLIATAAQGVSSLAQAGIHAGAGALAGGINAAIAGGNLGLGILVGGISGGIGKFAGGYFPNKFGAQLAGRTAIGGVTGGIASEIYGGGFGKGFIYGAATAAAGTIFNDWFHRTWDSVKEAFAREHAGLRGPAKSETGKSAFDKLIDRSIRLTGLGAGTGLVETGASVVFSGAQFVAQSPLVLEIGAGLFTVGVGGFLFVGGMLVISESFGFTNFSGLNSGSENENR